MTAVPLALPGVREAAEELVLGLARALDGARIPWCLVSGCALRGDATPSGRPPRRAARDLAALQRRLDPDDVDIVVDPAHFDRVRGVLARIPDARLVQARRYLPNSTRYDVVRVARGDRTAVLGVDVSADVRVCGTVLMEAREVLAGRERIGGVFWIPAPDAQFAFYLLKCLRKSRELGPAALTARHGTALSRLYLADPAGCRRRLARFFAPGPSGVIASAARSGRWDGVRSCLPALCGAARPDGSPRSLRQALAERLADWPRRLARVFRPTGLAIAVLGADGSGKTSVIAGVMDDLGPCFSAVRRYHLRPRFCWAGREDAAVRGPRAEPLRGPAASAAKLALWWVDYWTGFLFDVAPRLVRSTLVVFDRYGYDVLVDPARYRYGGPRWLARGFAALVPRPHLTVLLDAPAEVTDARRLDGSFQAPAAQRAAYAALLSRLPGGHVVDASRPLSEVIAGVERIVAAHLAARTARRRGG